MAVRKFARAEKKKKSQRINSLLLNNEAADFHRTLQREQGKSQEKQDNMPCFDEDERLVTEPKDILAARASYSEALAADPTGISQTPDRWRHVPRFGGEHEPLHIMRPLPPGVKFRDDEKDRVSPPLEADAFLMAIRQIQRNAAPGKDGVLAMHLKKFLQIECQLAISKEWKGCPKNYFGKNSYPQPLDYSTVAVDRWSLPAELSTPPLKHLLNIMRGCLTLKTQPRSWNEEILITLPKPGQDQRAVTDGVAVPGLTENLKGLLFADDTLIFADSMVEVTAICTKLEVYCEQWHFALGHEKCGIVKYKPALVPLKTAEGIPTKIPAPDTGPTDELFPVILKDGTIPIVETYKYLGCWFPNRSVLNAPYLMEMEHSQLSARKAEKCKFNSLPILHDKDIHLLSKARLIQSYIMAAGTYGAEWIGMGQKRTRNVQTVIDQAGRIAYAHQTLGQGSSSKDCPQRFDKLSPKGQGGKTWATNTRTNIVHYTTGLDVLEEEKQKYISVQDRDLWIRDMRALKKFLHPPALSPVGDSEKVTKEQKSRKKKLEEWTILLLHYEVARESKRNNAVARYDKYGFGKTSNYLATSINVPN
ncbi:hypothetical protein H4Q26_014792, partial [Puccinia striiformis f. sp. tritici PST-130]